MTESPSKAFRPVRVVWTQAEKEEVVAATWDLIAAEPGLEPVAALQDAQAKLFTGDRRNRRRPINRMADVEEWFPDMLRNYAKRQGKPIPPATEQALPQPQVGEPDPPPVGRVDPPAEPLIGLADQPTAALWAELGRRVSATTADPFPLIEQLAIRLTSEVTARTSEQTAAVRRMDELERLIRDRTDRLGEVSSEFRKRLDDADGFALALADEVAALHPAAEAPAADPEPVPEVAKEADVIAGPAPVVPHSPPTNGQQAKRPPLPRVFVPSLTDSQHRDFVKRFEGRAAILTASKHGSRVGRIPDAEYYVVQVRFAGTDYLRRIKDHVGKAGERRVVSVAGGLSTLFMTVHDVIEKHYAAHPAA
jgi:hypothetical protein